MPFTSYREVSPQSQENRNENPLWSQRGVKKHPRDREAEQGGVSTPHDETREKNCPSTTFFPKWQWRYRCYSRVSVDNCFVYLRFAQQGRWLTSRLFQANSHHTTSWTLTFNKRNLRERVGAHTHRSDDAVLGLKIRAPKSQIARNTAERRGFGLRNRSPKSQIASDFPSHP